MKTNNLPSACHKLPGLTHHYFRINTHALSLWFELVLIYSSLKKLTEDK